MSVEAPKHKVKLAMEIGLNRKKQPMFYVAECICGWSSPLCQTQSRANELYALHKAEAPAP